MTTVSVDATWRMSRVEFNTRHDTPWDIRGMGEVLLQEAEGSPIESILGTGTAREGEKKTYGVMPSAPVSRLIDDVMQDTVEIDGKTISFESIMQALPLFLQKWRAEDESKPPPQAMGAPQAAQETEMPPLRTPPKTDTPPPPPAETSFKG